MFQYSYSAPLDNQRTTTTDQSSSSLNDNSTPTTTELIVVEFSDKRYTQVLAAYHASLTNGAEITQEEVTQARKILQTLSKAYGEELTILRISRQRAVILKLSHPVDKTELKKRLTHSLNHFSINEMSSVTPIYPLTPCNPDKVSWMISIQHFI